jgi:hypothetical protein
MNTRAVSEGTDGLAVARTRLAENLRASGLAGATVSGAFAASGGPVRDTSYDRMTEASR